MGGRFGIGTACMIASGATALTVLTFLGSVFPYAPNDQARHHLLLAGVLPFFGFIAAVLFAASAALIDRSGLRRGWTLAPQLTACAVNLAILFSVVNQTAAALEQWFEGPPGSSENIDWLVRTGLVLGVAFLAFAIGAAIVQSLLRARLKNDPSE
ncbi:MAG: hypothetical protein GC188_00845 [Alphaproteobacteria bacterium]|nr:hypothetical protein [Alphaproteobacteria bacterium]